MNFPWIAKNTLVAALFLSCIAAQPARADVIVTGSDTVIVGGSRFQDDDNKDNIRNDNYGGNGYTLGRNGNIRIYNGNSSNNGGDAYIIKDGKFIRTPDGVYDLGDGDLVDTDRTYNGKVGNVEIRSPNSGYNGKVGDVEIHNNGPANNYNGKVGGVEIRN